MWKPDLCIYHGNCDDGFAAATIARMKWPRLPLFGAVHNKPLPVDVAGKHVLMVDFSYKHDVLAQAGWASCIILDHHKTAAADLENFQVDWISKGVDIIGKIAGTNAHFDMTKSGAMLTWEFCFPLIVPPRFVELIQKRDLWQLSEDVQAFSAAVRSYPQEFEIWEDWITSSDVRTPQLIAEGKPLLRSHSMTLLKILREAHMLRIPARGGGDHVVPAVNCPYHFASDAAHLLLEKNPDAPFAAAYFRRGDGRWQFSLRSDDNRYDSSAIATIFGGGGHRNASGFDIEDLDDLRLPVGGPMR